MGDREPGEEGSREDVGRLGVKPGVPVIYCQFWRTFRPSEKGRKEFRGMVYQLREQVILQVATSLERGWSSVGQARVKISLVQLYCLGV